jgi:predicted transcriptional regulator
MKTYRKNRTQKAKVFLVNGKAELGFLIGEGIEYKTIEKLSGEIFKINKNNQNCKLKDTDETVFSNDYVIVKCPI